MLLTVYIVSLSISIFLSRLPNTHYLIQVIPFLSIIINDSKINNKKIFYYTLYYLNIVLVILVVENLYFNNGYMNNLGLVKHQVELKEWIVDNLKKDDKIYLLRGHIIYNQIPQKSLTIFAHPNNIIKVNFLRFINDDENYSTRIEWEKIKKQKPRFIVTYKNDNLEYIIKKLNNLNNIVDKNILYEESIEVGIYKITPFFFN